MTEIGRPANFVRLQREALTELMPDADDLQLCLSAGDWVETHPGADPSPWAPTPPAGPRRREYAELREEVGGLRHTGPPGPAIVPFAVGGAVAVGTVAALAAAVTGLDPVVLVGFGIPAGVVLGTWLHGPWRKRRATRHERRIEQKQELLERVSAEARSEDADARASSEFQQELRAGRAAAQIAFVREVWPEVSEEVDAKLRQLDAGIRSEERVAAALRRSSATIVVHGAYFGSGGDVDHVALGPMAAAIETKTGHGVVRAVRQEGAWEITVGGRTVSGSPIDQATRAAEALSTVWGIEVAPVVCVADADVEPVQVAGVWVCNTVTLPDVVGELPSVVDESASLRLAALVEPAEETADLSKLHVDDLLDNLRQLRDAAAEGAGFLRDNPQLGEGSATTRRGGLR